MPMTGTTIRIDNVSKVYRLGSKEEVEDSLLKSLGKAIRSPLKNYRKYKALYNFSDVDLDTPSDNEDPNVLWALRDLSFKVNRGEIVGIIGRNGAGKSTLLKIMSRITPPTRGRVEIHGRTSSLLEVGTGFHNELTGRENVYLNGTILGMRKKEVDRRFDEIVEFSGVEKFLDTPVKRYSSGMRVRLAFAVAAHLEPEILIIDEVLAVGDGEHHHADAREDFQEKCLRKMETVGTLGRTVFFVSHNMQAVGRLCERVIMLDKGQVLADGPSHEIIARYMHEGSGSSAERFWNETSTAPGGEVARLKRVRIKNASDEIAPTIDIREPVGFEMTFEVIKEGYVLLPHFQLVNDEGVIAFLTLDVDPAWRKKKRPKGTYQSTAWVPGNFLSEGHFFIRAEMITLEPLLIEEFDEHEIVSFQVIDGMEGGLTARGDWAKHIPGLVRPLLRWETEYSPATG